MQSSIPALTGEKYKPGNCDFSVSAVKLENTAASQTQTFYFSSIEMAESYSVLNITPRQQSNHPDLRTLTCKSTPHINTCPCLMKYKYILKSSLLSYRTVKKTTKYCMFKMNFNSLYFPTMVP